MTLDIVSARCLLDDMIAKAASAGSDAALIRVAQLKALRATIGHVTTARHIHQLGQRQSAKNRSGRTATIILNAVDIVHSRRMVVDDEALAVQMEIAHQQKQTGRPKRVPCIATIRKYLRNPPVNLVKRGEDSDSL